MNDFKYVFGPIPSRRLGRSLGISPLPKKTCNYSCIYCQLGRTDKMTNKRQEFYKTEDIIAEFKQYLKDSDKFDIVTVVGEGEPTLAANLGELVVALKALTDKPVAVITNGALLSDPQVREELCHADMVLPSLDAYNQEISKKIDRPYGTIKFEEEFEGLKKFTHMYEGELWLEIMLVDGINDDEQSILKFQELLKELRENKKFSQDALAKKLGVSQSTLSSWELGLNFPRTDDLEKLCIELETNPNILLGFTDYNEDLLDELAKARNKINDLYEENQKLRSLIGDLTIEQRLGL